MDENVQNYISFLKSEKYHSSSPLSKDRIQKSEDDTFRSEQSMDKWKNEKLWPQKQYVLTSEMDPCKIFDGRLVDGVGKLNLSVELNQRNFQLQKYINQNLKLNNHEQALPNILNHKYFGDSKKIKQKHQDQVILNRLNMQAQDNRDNQSSFIQKESDISQFISKIMESDSLKNKQLSAANEKIRTKFQIENQISIQNEKNSQNTQQEVSSNQENQQNSELYCKESKTEQKNQSNLTSQQILLNNQKQGIMESNEKKFRYGKRNEDGIIKKMKNEQIIKKNGLVLECIMRDRGKQQVENNITTELFKQMRDIQQREGTYKYQGTTHLPGSRAEKNQNQDSSILLVQLRNINNSQNQF